MSGMEVCPQYIPEFLGCLVTIIIPSEGHKNCFKDECLIEPQPTFLILPNFSPDENAMLSEVRKLHNFESHSFLMISFINI